MEQLYKSLTSHGLIDLNSWLTTPPTPVAEDPEAIQEPSFKIKTPRMFDENDPRNSWLRKSIVEEVKLRLEREQKLKF